MIRGFRQVDVFSEQAFRGNPVAVVLDGAELSTEEMLAFASWTNLSETTFLLPPEATGADYRVRIFTPSLELPFAGHPTLGSCHAWLSSGGEARAGDEVVQECGAGLVRVRRQGSRLAFAAPPLLREGPVDDATLDRVVTQLGITRADVVDAQWADNGPGWVALLLASAEAVLALRPGTVDLDIGVVGPHPVGAEAAWEVRAFLPKNGSTDEDPVTGSLNASVGQWLLGTGRATSPYVAAQGTALGRVGRVHVARDDDGTVWVGGATVTRVTGDVDL
jgi:PhzF family phenazine biosynthesis protein